MLTSRRAAEETERLFAAPRAVLDEWTARLRAENAGVFPAKVTAFHESMAVHGRYRLPCPVCGTAVQRIRYATNETNYCPRCQTGGRLLADRSLSRLLKKDWPRTVEAWESGVNARQD
jgi:formamidopyrimidine-DNA glycosylase